MGTPQDPPYPMPAPPFPLPDPEYGDDAATIASKATQTSSRVNAVGGWALGGGASNAVGTCRP
jgi:hypothetical protein